MTAITPVGPNIQNFEVPGVIAVISSNLNFHDPGIIKPKSSMLYSPPPFLKITSFQKFKLGLIDNQVWKKTFCKFGLQKKVRFYRQPLGKFEKSEVL